MIGVRKDWAARGHGEARESVSEAAGAALVADVGADGGEGGVGVALVVEAAVPEVVGVEVGTQPLELLEDAARGDPFEVADDLAQVLPGDFFEQEVDVVGHRLQLDEGPCLLLRDLAHEVLERGVDLLVKKRGLGARHGKDDVIVHSLVHRFPLPCFQHRLLFIQ